MKALMLFTGSGPIVVLTSHASVTDRDLMAQLKAKGIEKFVAYELPLESVKQRYGGHFQTVLHNLHETDDLRVLDFDGQRAFRLFGFHELGPALEVEAEHVAQILEPAGPPKETVAKTAVGSTRKAKIEQLENHLRSWDKRLGEIERIMQKGDRKARTCCEKERRALVELRQLAGDTLAQLRLEEARSWEEENFRTGVLDIFDEIGHSLDRLVSRMKATASGR